MSVFGLAFIFLGKKKAFGPIVQNESISAKLETILKCFFVL